MNSVNSASAAYIAYDISSSNEQRKTTTCCAYQSTTEEVDAGKEATTSGTILKGEDLNFPTPKSLMEDTAVIYNRLDELFEENGFEKNPPVSFDVKENGEIIVTGDRDDLEDIEKLVNEDPEIKRQIQNVIASSELITKLARSVEYSNAIANSDDPNSIAAKYSRQVGVSSEAIDYLLNYGEGYSDKAASYLEDSEIFSQNGTDFESYGFMVKKS